MEFLAESLTLALQVLIPNLDEDVLVRTTEDIIARYEEPWRHYHSLPHVVALLRVLHERVSAEQFESMGEQSVACLILMCVYHDIIYVPGAKGNEELSALYLRSLAQENDISLEKLAPALRGVAASKNHFVRSRELSRAEHLFLDADLSILATADWIRYQEYVNDVCSEYETVGVEVKAFFEGRKAFLRAALESGTPFFHTTEFAHMNDLAFRNMTRELQVHEEEG